MSEPALTRSPELMSRDDTALVVIDAQSVLLELIQGSSRLVWNMRRLIDAAQVLQIPVVATEQNPDKLGSTETTLAARLPDIAAKMCFSCGECGELFRALGRRGIDKLLLCGLETHVCVQQTAFDLIGEGFRVYLAVDALGARHALDHEVALQRMDSAGATVTTTEAALFEWCERAGTPAFRQISQLVRERPPEA